MSKYFHKAILCCKVPNLSARDCKYCIIAGFLIPETDQSCGRSSCRTRRRAQFKFLMRYPLVISQKQCPMNSKKVANDQLLNLLPSMYNNSNVWFNFRRNYAQSNGVVRFSVIISKWIKYANNRSWINSCFMYEMFTLLDHFRDGWEMYIVHVKMNDLWTRNIY